VNNVGFELWRFSVILWNDDKLMPNCMVLHPWKSYFNIEQINIFNCLKYSVSYEGKRNLIENTGSYIKILCIVTCQPIFGLCNRALLGSRLLNTSRPNTRYTAIGEAVSSPCRAEPIRVLLHNRPWWRHTAPRSFPRQRSCKHGDDATVLFVNSLLGYH
jgi:hypothetical protein